MDRLERMRQWHQTRAGLLAFAAAEFVVAYLFSSRAIDTGSLSEYFVALVLLVSSLRNIVLFLGTFFRGQHRRQTTKA